MKIVIIGLGIYGSNLATDLTDMGHEVIGADNNQSIVDSIKDYISTAYYINATDENALGVLPLRNADIVFVTIGENFGASVKTVALLKKMKVKHIYARAIDNLHHAILESFGIERIIAPEQRAARDMSYELALGSEVESMLIDGDRYIMKFQAHKLLLGLKYSNLGLEKDYNLTLIAASRQKDAANIMGVNTSKAVAIDLSDPDIRIEEGDTLTCIGTASDYKKMFRQLK